MMTLKTSHTVQERSYSLKETLVSILTVIVLTSCANQGSFQSLKLDNLSSPNNSNAITSLPGTVGDTGGSTASSGGTTSVSSTFTAGYKPQALSWESSKYPQRANWSQSLYGIIASNFGNLDQANDIDLFCPRYYQLTRDQKINTWAAVIAATTYFESAYNPSVNSVDVGTNSDKSTWSVGLLQLSVIDQQSYNIKYGYTFTDLQDPVKNLRLGVAILSKQVVKYGGILIPVGSPGLYWATLHPGGKYDASDEIEQMTQRLTFCN